MRKSYNTKFENAGNVERELARKLAAKLECNCVAAPEKCHYDAVFEKNGVVSVVECKVRTFEHDRYDSALIEKPKFDNLLGYIDSKMCHKALYVMFYTDNVALVWNLANFTPGWGEDDFVKTTMGDRSKKTKVVGYLPIDQATRIEL